MSICLNSCRLLARVLPAVLPCYVNNCCRRLTDTRNMPFYAVAKGVVPGIYTEWSECQKQVQGFKGPQFKKFATREEAEDFIGQRVGNVVDKRKPAAADEASSNGAAKKRKTHDGAAQSGLPSNLSQNASSSRAGEPNLSPELLLMKQELKRQQKELSLLRQRFDAYVASSAVASGGSEEGAKTAPADKGKKRDRSPDSASSDAGDKQSADGYESVIRKKIMQREVPDKEKFEVDDTGNVVVYTDGCCEFNGRHGAKAGVGVYFGPNNPLNISEPVRGRATNNTAEIQAITYALELIKRAGFTKAVINTDSQFVINCMTSWLSGWKKKGWKKSDGSAVINKEDLIDLDKASDGLMVKYNHVKGHSGLEGNERADELAKAGAKHYDADVKE